MSKWDGRLILLLDTSILIDVLRGRQHRLSLLDEFTRLGHTLATSSINIAEVYAGLRPGVERMTESVLSKLRCYHADELVARRAGLLRRDFARRGLTFGLPDMVVAATALEYDLTLVTDNRQDFPIPELRLYDLP